MMDETKIMFSDAEKLLMADSAIILTKHAIISKVEMLFGELAPEFQLLANPLFGVLPEVFGPHPKISKGEKYQQMPWVMLDYPRCFNNLTGQFAIRCFFWWGNYYSIQLQLSGKYKTDVMTFLHTHHENVHLKGWYIGLTDDAWDYRLPNQKWVSFDSPNPDELILKIAKRIEFDQKDQIKMKFETAFSELNWLLKIAFMPLADEINL